jgi:hypothetical protein
MCVSNQAASSSRLLNSGIWFFCAVTIVYSFPCSCLYIRRNFPLAGQAVTG